MKKNLSSIVFFLVLTIFIVFKIFNLNNFKNVEDVNLNIENNFEKSKDYSFLYFEENFPNQDIYMNILLENDFIEKIILKYNAKLIISSRDINVVYNELLDNTIKISDKLMGLYEPNSKVLLIKDIDVSSNKIDMKYGEEVLIKDKFSKEEIYDINYESLKNVLYHEVGHLLLDFNKFTLKEKITSHISYMKESEFISNRSYIYENYDEFLAESISNYLNFENVQVNGENTKVAAKTQILISNYIDKIMKGMWLLLKI